MAVGGEGVRLFASESYDKRLKVGQVVQYWSTSKNKWIDAVVRAVDATGAVQISVKPRAWLNQQEQSTKIRSIVPLLAQKSAEPHGENKTTEFIAESSQRPENTKYTNGFSTNGVTNGTRPPAAGAAADAAQRSDRSKALYSVFSEWDSQRQGITKDSGPVVPGRIPPSGLRQELKVFKENEKDIRQYKLFLLQQPQRCVRKRVTSLLWQTFYNVVREKCAKLRQQPDRRTKANGDGSGSSRADLEAEFKVALEEAETCLQHICTEVREKVESADSSEEDAERLQAHREILGHLCIMLADLERYRATSGSGDSKAALARADKLYCASLSACSELGQAFNQRGLVAAHQGNKLKAVRCGFHSMLCAIRFPKSEQNLLVWLGQVAEDTVPQSVVDRLRGAPVMPNLGRAAQGAVCQLQLTLLQLRDGDSGEPAQRQGAIGELINKAQAKMKEAVAGMDTDKGDQGQDLEWILETLMISICAAAYHRRGQPQATGKPTVLDKLMDGYTSTAFWAWDWVVRFGLCLAKETKEGEREESGASPFLAPLGLLCLLAARVVPHSWRSSVSAPLHDALRQLNMSEENTEAAELLRFALPEDEVAAGLLPIPDTETESKQGSRAAAGKTSEDEASEDEVVLQTPVVKVASPEKKVDSPGSNPVRTGQRPMAPAHLHTQVRRARLSFCLRAAAEGAAKDLRPEAPPPRGPETRLPAGPAAADFQGAWGAWGEGHGWAEGYDESGWPAWGNDEWGDGWAENHMDEGQTLEELGEEPDLWDMPDMAAAGDAPWYGGYGYGPPGDAPSVPPGYGASAWLAGTQEAWYGMAQNPPVLPAAAPGLEAVGCLGPPPGLARMPESHPEVDGCHLPLVDLAFLDEDADMDPKPSIAGPSVLGANRRPPPPSCLPPPPPRGH